MYVSKYRNCCLIRTRKCVRIISNLLSILQSGPVPLITPSSTKRALPSPPSAAAFLIRLQFNSCKARIVRNSTKKPGFSISQQSAVFIRVWLVCLVCLVGCWCRARLTHSDPPSTSLNLWSRGWFSFCFWFWQWDCRCDVMWCDVSNEQNRERAESRVRNST